MRKNQAIILLYIPTHSDTIDLPLQPTIRMCLNRITMKKAKPAQNNKLDTNAKKRSPSRKRGFPLQLFFSFYTARVR